MKIKYPYDILMIGVFSSWFLGFLFFLFQALRAGENITAGCLGLAGAVFIMLYKSRFDKYEDQSKLEWVEPSFWFGSLMMVVTAVVVFLLTLSPYWLAKELRYFALIFGLPSLIAMFYWKLYKRRNAN